MARDYEHCLYPLLRFLLNLKYRFQNIRPVEKKMLHDGYTVSWFKKSKSYEKIAAAVVFETPDGKQIVFAPENVDEYFAGITEMESLLEDEDPFSIPAMLNVHEQEVLLALVRDTYRRLHDDGCPDRYQTRLGVSPYDAQTLIGKLQKSVASLGPAATSTI